MYPMWDVYSICDYIVCILGVISALYVYIIWLNSLFHEINVSSIFNSTS